MSLEMSHLTNKVEQWSEEKGLDQADSSKQFLKVTEEVGEVAAALARSDKDALKDGIGDVLVTLIILAQQNDMTIDECLETAYNEIKDRKGKLINGTFVKESDLQEG
ncbi:MazG-like family protein [Gracilibacillus thailandensis]|nr:MazG-like family protein [Gracilibacillus thailandensis]